jgi:KUP system potassium uptake protein
MAQSQAVASVDDRAHGQNEPFTALMLGSIGVVYGDIGTSPLYAFREAIKAGRDGGIADPSVVIGTLSLLLWALILIVTVKYVLILLNADNKGEGGTFALMALGQHIAKRSAPLLMGLGIAGASFFYGDAVITPAISVLSAVEGLKDVSSAFDALVLPLSLVILMGLFWAQAHGTAKVARLFGPIMVVWFAILAIGGLMNLPADPAVLWAVNPFHGMKFLVTHGLEGFRVMGLVFLAVTGAEALYADLGHFGPRPIQAAWLWLVFPALALNYLGQGSFVLSHPEMLSLVDLKDPNADPLKNLFYLLYPNWALVPMIVFATVATVIASQAVITGAFSLTRQATQLGFLPRLAIRHTSEMMAGQIYMPSVNFLLLVGVLIVTMAFRSSDALGAAYGVSVTATMVITSIMAVFVIWRMWGWSLWKTLALMIPLILVEQAFFAANMLKVFEGGWMPLMIAGFVGLIMATWVRGSHILMKQTRKNEADIDWLVRKLETKPPHRVPGTAVFLTSDINAAPTSLMHNLKHNRVLHERNIILSIRTVDTPRVARHERVTIDKVSDTFIRVIARYGFMETPSVPKILDHCRRKDLKVDMGATSFFLSRRSLRATPKSEMMVWQERLFIGLTRTSQDATTYFQIPSDRVVEVGTQVLV